MTLVSPSDRVIWMLSIIFAFMITDPVQDH